MPQNAQRAPTEMFRNAQRRPVTLREMSTDAQARSGRPERHPETPRGIYGCSEKRPETLRDAQRRLERPTDAQRR